MAFGVLFFPKLLRMYRAREMMMTAQNIPKTVPGTAKVVSSIFPVSSHLLNLFSDEEAGVDRLTKQLGTSWAQAWVGRKDPSI